MKTGIFAALSWSASTKISSAVLQVVTFFIYAKLLSPRDFGIIAIVSVSTGIGALIISSGLCAANIQRSAKTQEVFSTLFFLGLAGSASVCWILFIVAPYMDLFLGYDGALTSPLRAASFAVIFSTLNSLQISELSRGFDFKATFYFTIIPTTAAAAVCLSLAYADFGVYAMVLNLILVPLLGFVTCAVGGGLYPSIIFSRSEARWGLKFARNIVTANILEEVYRAAVTVSIGKVSSAATLGEVNTGRQIPGVFTATVNATIASVFYPKFAEIQYDPRMSAAMLRRVTKCGNLFIYPVMGLIIINSETLIAFTLGEKWLGAAMFLSAFSVVACLHHNHYLPILFLNANGRTTLALRLELIKKSASFGVLALTVIFGVNFIIGGVIFSSVIWIVIGFIGISRVSDYGIREQVLDTVPLLFLTGVLVALFSLLGKVADSTFADLFARSAGFLALYLFCASLFLKSELTYLFGKITGLVKSLKG
jgi:teichuronic acid exporter